MADDVLTNEVEKLKSLSTSRGLRIPNIDEIEPEVSIRDYNLALIEIINKFEGVYPIIQDIRSRKFMYEFSTKWNPFAFHNTQRCKPYFVSDIEEFGFDPNTGNCKCPDVYLPCTLNQAINDKPLWPKDILDAIEEHQRDTNPENLKIAISSLETIDINGDLLDKAEKVSTNEEKDSHCKSSDVILCSIQDSESLTTDWSEWSGCNAKCGPGTQQRHRINYDGKFYRLVKESKPCELEVCKDVSKDSSPRCTLKTISINNKVSVVNKCECPGQKDKICSSEEALNSIDHWIHKFRTFCEEELNNNKEINILQEDLMDQKREIMGRTIKIEFSDGFYFDCSENWGIKEVDYLHIYCKSGSPILCKNEEETLPIKFSALEIKRINKIPTYITTFVWAYLAYLIFKFVFKIIKGKTRK